MTLHFHIIYTPGTVEYLSFLVWSLVKWSDCSFQLVANGCRAEEKEHLRALCQRSPRLMFLDLPFSKMASHGQALNHLQAATQESHFCFVDSDIFATGDFLASLAPQPGGPGITFANILAVYRKAEDETNWYRGTYMGCSYLAIYDNRILSEFIQSTGLGFDPYAWSQIPTDYQDQLTQMGLEKPGYDTGKLLNLMLLAQGRRFSFLEPSALRHLGGISRPAELSLHGWSELWPMVLKHALRMVLKPRGRSPNAIKAFYDKRQRKWRTTVYFFQLLQALHEQQPRPPLPRIGDAGVAARIKQVTEELVALHEEYTNER
jgi:hypothetical protein